MCGTRVCVVHVWCMGACVVRGAWAEGLPNEIHVCTHQDSDLKAACSRSCERHTPPDHAASATMHRTAPHPHAYGLLVAIAVAVCKVELGREVAH
jgi:hypothetical protein